MRHGIDGYFERLERDRRRVSQIGITVTLVLLAAALAARRPEIVSALNDPRRFGFEGEDQYVRRILLEQVADVEQPGAAVPNIVPIEMRAGGGTRRRHPAGDAILPGGKRPGEGPGDDTRSLESRLRALALEGPLVRSEDLVVEKLVRPEYPEEARSADIEGVVELVALVDTTGNVTEVHIIGGSHVPSLERSATSAALQCRYRPYRLNESAPQRVWAYFRVSFSLY
jgi:TonB family protein